MLKQHLMKTKHKLAQLGSPDKNGNSSVTGLVSSIQGRQSGVGRMWHLTNSGTPCLKDLGQDQVLWIITSDNTNRAQVARVAYLTLFRKVKEQEGVEPRIGLVFGDWPTGSPVLLVKGRHYRNWKVQPADTVPWVRAALSWVYKFM